MPVRPNWSRATDGVEVTPEEVFANRRRFLKAGLATIAAIGGSGLALHLAGQQARADDDADADNNDAAEGEPQTTPTSDLYPAPLNEAYTLDRDLSAETDATRYNNFYEFTTDKTEVWKKVDKFEIRPWTVEIAGHVKEAKTWDIDDLIKRMDLEERTYRFRCVETWAMAVPWTGFPLKQLIDLCEPTGQAKYIRFVSFNKPDQAPGMVEYDWYNWPYYEGLSMAEAANELTLGVTGIYGKELPKQNGAPLRVITPWKYGYKSPKSIVKIEFVSEQPATFWNDANPDEYSFESNVDPDVPHPRWSQAHEWMIPDRTKKIKTQKYNGYGEYVADLYE